MDVLENFIEEINGKINSNNEIIKSLLPRQTYDKNKWKYICFDILEEIKLKQYKDMIGTYRNKLSDFAEEYLGIKLKPYQKILIDNMNKIDYNMWEIRGININFDLYSYLYKLLYNKS